MTKKATFPIVRVMGYQKALEYVYCNSGKPNHTKYAIISIQDPTFGYGFGMAFQKGGNCLAALNIEFSDCTPAISLPETVLMTMEDAWKIHDFVENLPAEVELLIIHCQAGQSRSPAVAAAILLVKTGSHQQICENESDLLNKYVYFNVLETYGFANDYLEKYFQEDKKLAESTITSFDKTTKKAFKMAQTYWKL